MSQTHAAEIAAGDRFGFGENWARFLAKLDDHQIGEARRSLVEMLHLPSLEGKRFLDVGSGSGLFSLAAKQLGASVYSLDYDPNSVACTAELKRLYFPADSGWTVEEGSALDAEYLRSLGQFDIVYSWGVLHHTGNMQMACANVAETVAPGGKLVLAIYNDQGSGSAYWLVVKRWYNRLPGALKWTVLIPAFIRLWGPTTVRDFVKGRPFRTWRTYKSQGRGMTPWRDVVDWVGGYPFEVAKPEEMLELFQRRGFALTVLKTCGGGHGCNEFVFSRTGGP